MRRQKRTPATKYKARRRANLTRRSAAIALVAREQLYRANRRRFGESGTSVAAFDAMRKS